MNNPTIETAAPVNGESATPTRLTPKIKLRPCPFCGKRPSLRKGSRYVKDHPLSYWRERFGAVAGAWRWMPGIRCTACKIDREFESVEDAVCWWNGEQRNTQPSEVTQ